MTDILDEVESDYRAEQLRAVALRYAWLAGAIVVLTLAGAAAWQVWQARQARAATSAATAFLADVRKADAATDAAARLAAAARFASLADTAPAGYRSLARLRGAALLADAGRLADAQTVWDRVATDPDTPTELRQLASLLWVQRSIDSADPAALHTRLLTLTSADNPYRPLARESEALLDLRQNRKDQARTVLRQLAADPAAPAAMRDRDAALLTILG